MATIFGGGLLGIGLIQPFALVVFWLQFRGAVGEDWAIWLMQNMELTVSRTSIFQADLAYAFFGVSIAWFFQWLHGKTTTKEKAMEALEGQLADILPDLIRGGETDTVEFKSSMRWDQHQQKPNKKLEGVIVKAIAGFLNSQGGTLLIGVDDDGRIIGLKPDYSTLKKKNKDGFQLALMDLITKKLGGDIAANVAAVIHNIDGEDVCRVICQPASRPVYFKEGPLTDFYLRSGCSTRALSIDEAISFIKIRWP